MVYTIYFMKILSGTTSEFYNMLLIMAFGKQPFFLNEKGNLTLKFEPILANWLFTEKETQIKYYIEKEIKQLNVPSNSFLMSFMYDTIVFFLNPKRKDTYGENSVKLRSYKLYGKNGETIVIDSHIINMPYSLEIREGKYSKIEVLLD